MAAAVVLSDLPKKLRMDWFCGFFFALLIFPVFCRPRVGSDGVFLRFPLEPSREDVLEVTKGDFDSLPGGVGGRPVAGTAFCTCVVALRNISAGRGCPASVLSLPTAVLNG